VGDDGVKALIMLPGLKKLVLSANDITNEGAELLLGVCGHNFRVDVYKNSRVNKDLIQMIHEKSRTGLYESKKRESNQVQPGKNYTPTIWKETENVKPTDGTSDSKPLANGHNHGTANGTLSNQGPNKPNGSIKVK
jgi:hypothetical protein